MSKNKIFCLKDNKTSLWGRPFLERTSIDAIRGFRYVVNNTEAQCAKYPEDFDLYEVGEYPEDAHEIGQFWASPQFVINGYNVKEQPNISKEGIENVNK